MTLAALAAGCGGSDAAQEPEVAPTGPPETVTAAEPPAAPSTETAPPAEASPLPGLPRYTAGYDTWTRLNAKAIPPRDSDPHLGTKHVYASRDARRNGVYPPGSIVVKDARRPGKSFVGLVAVMRKVPGADPAHNDWVFVEFTRERRNDPFGEAARGAVCTSCHIGAADADYVWIAQLGLTK